MSNRYAATSKAYYEAHREEILAKKRAYYLANRERALEQAKARHLVKREEIIPKMKERSKRHYEANKEARLQQLAEYRRNNPDKVCALAGRYRADRHSRTPAWADLTTIASVYAVAAAWRRAGVSVHVDHVVPLRGAIVSGLHVHENLSVVPASHNLKKSCHHEP